MPQSPTGLATIGFAFVMLVILLVVGMMRPTTHNKLAAIEPVVYRIDPNTADVDELSLLPGIGPGIARRIVDDRRANGRFDSAIEMQRVPYVGEKTAAAIDPWIEFEPEKP